MKNQQMDERFVKKEIFPTLFTLKFIIVEALLYSLLAENRRLILWAPY